MRRYGLPEKIRFCKKCVMPNTRPASSNEYTHTHDRQHTFIDFDDEGVCSACRFCEAKDNKVIDWEERERELIELLDQYRSTDGSYDILVPGSGGKDSVFASHILKHKYGMHPLTVTWSPHLYTDVGWKNFSSWVHKGSFDNYLFTPDGEIHRLLTRNAFLNLLHPFQPFILGQKTFAVKMAARFGIPLVFYGESPGEYGANISVDQKGFTSVSEKETAGTNAGHSLRFIDKHMKDDEIFLGGVSVADYIRSGVQRGQLEPFLPLDTSVIEEKGIDFRYLGYYIKWIPQECYYYAAEHVDFEANPVRTEGTYSKYNSIDDKTDGFFYYTTYIKFGYGRATQDAAQEIRNHHITREEGVALVNRYDGEFPQKYFDEFLNYISLTEEEFWKTIDSFRDDHLWRRVGNEWRIKHKVS